jgi:hypothetical protein
LAVAAYPFDFSEELQLIVVIVSIDDYDVRLALDTGASKTVIDLTELLIAGYQKSAVIGTEEFETGKGNIIAEIYEISEIEALGITHINFEVCCYDFLVNGVLSEIHGVLGLDFFAGCKFCIDMEKLEITIHKNKS